MGDETWSRISVLAAVYRLRTEWPGDRSLIVASSKTVIFLASRPDRLWGPPCLPCNGCRRQNCMGVKLTTHRYIMSRLRMNGAIFLLLLMPSCRTLGKLSHTDMLRWWYQIFPNQVGLFYGSCDSVDSDQAVGGKNRGSNPGVYKIFLCFHKCLHGL